MMFEALKRTCPYCEDCWSARLGAPVPPLQRCKPSPKYKDRRWCPRCHMLYHVQQVGSEVWHTELGKRTLVQYTRIMVTTGSP